MKKTYQAPDICIITPVHETALLAGSPVPKTNAYRRVGYEVSDLYDKPAAALEGSGKVLPNEIWEVSTFDGDPFGGHGQGNGGEGTRSNSGLWED